jgi:hypothetical protein
MDKKQRSDQILNWCIDNIGPVKYEMPHIAGNLVGGLGWELYISPTQVISFINDESLKTFFNLSFINH